MIIVAIAIIMFLGCDNTKDQSSRDQMPTTTTISSTTTDVTTETSVTTSTTTTTDTTSSSTSTTSATNTATKVVATTEYMEEETVFVVVEEKSVVKEPVEEYIPTTTEEYQQTTHTETETIPVTEEETYYEETTQSNNMTINYSINELTYYSGPSGCKGRWGRTLLNNYSIASNLLSDGSIVHIESNDGSINGDYRVDDTGGMGNNVIDIFYTSYSNVPYPFSRDGRISCTVWVYE
jgi:hypothetical protein